MNQATSDLKQRGIRGLFLVWGYPQGSHRSQLMAQALHMPIEHVYLTKRQGVGVALLKYVVQTVQTPLVLWRHRAEVVFVQNPPIFGAMVVYLWGAITGTKFIIDSHTDALLASWWAWSLPYHGFLSRRAITTLVTNEHLANLVTAWDAPAFILVDPPETHTQLAQVTLATDQFHVVVVSSASYDEPIGAIFEAVGELDGVQVYITGNFDKTAENRELKANKPDNVNFTGYIADDAFYGLLKAADVVMSLTTEDHTIQSGASEALWLGKPIITSDWPLLRRYFTQGAALVDNTAAGIRQGIETVRQNQPQFEADIMALQTQRRAEWWQQANQLLDLIERRCAG